MNSIRINSFSAARTARVIGISYRQLDYWIRSGLINPSLQEGQGAGSRRLFNFDDLLQLRVIKGLLDRGVSLQRVRAGIVYLKDHLNFEKPLKEVTLVTDGHDIFAICRESKEVVDILKSGQAVFGLALGDLYDELEGVISKMAPEKGEIIRPQRDKVAL